MDSLTQITLGAAVGEALLGKKIGNRAMVWGAIGATIPDLDVISNFFIDPIPALAFHRGLSHSLFFSLTLPILLAWLVHRLYNTATHRRLWYKVLVSVVNVILLGVLMIGLYFLFGQKWWLIPALIITGIYLIWRLYHYYLIKELESVHISYGKWYLLFFLALSTHFILDCFTAFGTQVFQPFSHYRVAFNNISVVDPLYTVPFIICVIIACNIKRQKLSRTIVNYAGIAVSSLYMLFTVFNKLYVDSVFEKALQHRNLEVDRCRCSPTIFNNFLWNCVAEADSAYYLGLYSLFDSDPDLHYLNVLPKHEDLVRDIEHLKEYRTLQWFSDGYLLPSQKDSTLILSDVRYGGTRDTILSPRDLIFNFIVNRKPDGTYSFIATRERPDDFGKAFGELWTRMKGR